MAMQRIAILVKPEQSKKLASLAKNEGVSLGEMHRRAIDNYIATPNQDEDFKALNIMLDALKKSNKEAENALTQAFNELSKIVKEIHTKKE